VGKGISLQEFHFLPTKEWVAVEPQFYALLLEKRGIGDPAFAVQWEERKWPGLKVKLARSPIDYQRNKHAVQRQKSRR
jgi:hypothetical protein